MREDGGKIQNEESKGELAVRAKDSQKSGSKTELLKTWFRVT